MSNFQVQRQVTRGFAAFLLSFITALPLHAAHVETPHWAFRPSQNNAPPTVTNTKWAKSPLDQFILARLEAKGLQPAQEANREQYIRRVTYTLTGLPPTPAEIDAYLADQFRDADKHLIDRLLESPHYGERWARHWLDLARFGETDGFEHDAVRPNAWRYRDYVVNSFNEDKPYTQFIKEQIAGDLLYPDNASAIIATGFNLLGPDMVDSSDQVQRRHNTLNDMTDTTALTFLGLTFGCARCHDHKLEPISQEDYFGLQAFYTPSEFQHKLDVATPADRARHAKEAEKAQRQKQPLLKEITETKSPYAESIRKDRLASLSEKERKILAIPKDQRTPDQEKRFTTIEKKLKVDDKELLAKLSSDDRKRIKSLEARIEKIKPAFSLPLAMGLKQGKDAKTFVLFRGEYSQPRDEVQPAFPKALKPPKPDSSSRTALAEWIASPDNPLTARVMVNRIWQHHFGRGIVSTPSDFGLQGSRPTHPELLDWLAHQFIESGWSIKAMHRLILLSATYRQSSTSSESALAKDPDNLLFSRRHRVRLDGESIRDSLFAISGTLNRKMGGPGVFPPIPKALFEGARGWKVSPDESDHRRRSIYIFVRRNLRYPFLEVFDAPDSNLSCPERGRSTSAPQSLTLLNAETVLNCAQTTANLVRTQANTQQDQIELLYRMILGRLPTENELHNSRDFLKQSPPEELCRALFNLNSFVYVE